MYTAKLAASFTISRISSHITSFNDLLNRNRFDYATLLHLQSADHFRRMPRIEKEFADHWKYLTKTGKYRDIFPIWEYPLYQNYIKMWRALNITGSSNTLAEAIDRVKIRNLHSSA